MLGRSVSVAGQGHPDYYCRDARATGRVSGVLRPRTGNCKFASNFKTPSFRPRRRTPCLQLSCHPLLLSFCSARSPSQLSLSPHPQRHTDRPTPVTASADASSTRCLENPVVPHRVWALKSLDHASVGREGHLL